MDEGTAAGRLALSVAAQQAETLARLRDELGPGSAAFAEAAQRLSLEFGAVTATAVDALDCEGDGAGVDVAEAPAPTRPADEPEPSDAALPGPEPDEGVEELPSLYRPGHMRRRLDQLVETNRRYDHPFAVAVFDASGPATKEEGDQETVLAVVGAALRDSIRIVDEAFRLEEDAICVLAPNLRTVEAVQMCERLLGLLDDLERVGGMKIAVSAGVAACPEHGSDAAELLRKADAAMWRARAVGQPVGIGALQDR